MIGKKILVKVKTLSEEKTYTFTQTEKLQQVEQNQVMLEFIGPMLELKCAGLDELAVDVKYVKY